MFNQDRAHYGYYQIGHYKTFSKVEAMEIEEKTHQSITWHFNDEVYSSYDWTAEPSSTTTDLYINRAKQLRNKYDYLVLFYSGGSDSHNMLMSFINAGIFIDEIACLSYINGDKDQQSFMNREIYETALPKAHELIQNNPIYKNTTITEIDLASITKTLFNRLSIEDFQYFANTVPSVNNIAKSFIRETSYHYQQIINQQKMAFVWGSEKPLRIWFKNGKFYFQFTDLFECCVSARTQYLNRPNEHDELFYSSPDCPEINIKQCHLVKNFLINATVPHPWLSNSEPNSFGHIPKWYNNDWQTFWVTKNGINYIVYPWFDDSLYSQPKITNVIYSGRDHWFYQHPEASQPFHYYVKLMTEKYGSKWIYKDTEKNLVIVRKIFSKEYCLTK